VAEPASFIDAGVTVQDFRRIIRKSGPAVQSSAASINLSSSGGVVATRDDWSASSGGSRNEALYRNVSVGEYQTLMSIPPLPLRAGADPRTRRSSWADTTALGFLGSTFDPTLDEPEDYFPSP
jgi:hypothetical protein